MALQYDKIIKYRATATCMEPLHIGNAMGAGEEVLVHPVDEMPFIQASSIAGVFRDYVTRAGGAEAAAGLFGTDRRSGGGSGKEKGTGKVEDRNIGEGKTGEETGNAGERFGWAVVQEDTREETGKAGERFESGKAQETSGDSSRIRFTDGIFLTDRKGIRMELRPRLAIDPVTGTCGGSVIMGTDRRAGHKFNTEYVGAGAEFQFCAYLYDPGYQEGVEDIFAALNGENIQFGGQKSNGCGYVRIDRLQRAVFDMKNPEDRKKWAGEESLSDGDYTDLTKELPLRSGYRNAYEITLSGRTEGELLVKGIAVMEEGENAPDAVNIRNAGGDYIVPGSSLKGAVRSQMEKIAAYLGCREVIVDTFGRKADGAAKGSTGNISFFDTVVGEAAANDKAAVRHRIHIDKFTGGVMERALFSEKNVSGKLTLRMVISDKNKPDKSCGLLLLALRDLAAGTMSLGGGYNVGKGIVDVDTITVRGKDGGTARIHWKTGKTEDESGLIARAMAALHETAGD